MKPTPDQELETANVQLELYRTKVVNCKSPTSFDGLYNKFLDQEIVVKGVQDKIDNLIL
jgi:hypothetical protein